MRPTPMSWEATKESVSTPLADTPTTISYTDINNFKIPKKRINEPIPVYYNGVMFPSQNQCAKTFGIDVTTIRSRMSRLGCTFAEALDSCIKKLNKHEMASFVDCAGVKHKSLPDALRYYKLAYQRVVYYAKKHGITGSKNIMDTLLQNPEVYRQLTTLTKTPSSVHVVVNGKEYPSRSSCFAALGLCETNVNRYIRNNNITVEEAVNFFLAKQEENNKGKVTQPTTDEPTLPSAVLDVKQTTEKKETSEPIVTLTIQPSDQPSDQPIFELADEPRGRDLMIELLDLWTNLLRKHWLGEELMCDEWRENFREFEADMLALGYETATQVTRSNTNRMWRKDNITVK